MQHTAKHTNTFHKNQTKKMKHFKKINVHIVSTKNSNWSASYADFYCMIDILYILYNFGICCIFSIVPWCHRGAVSIVNSPNRLKQSYLKSRAQHLWKGIHHVRRVVTLARSQKCVGKCNCWYFGHLYLANRLEYIEFNI